MSKENEINFDEGTGSIIIQGVKDHGTVNININKIDDIAKKFNKLDRNIARQLLEFLDHYKKSKEFLDTNTSGKIEEIIILLKKRRRLSSVITFVITFAAVILIIFGVILFLKYSECKTINISGKLVNRLTNKSLQNVRVEIENEPLRFDDNIINGQFSIQGVELTSNKIISLIIGLSDNTVRKVANIDLGDPKYKIKDGNINLGTQYIVLDSNRIKNLAPIRIVDTIPININPMDYLMGNIVNANNNTFIIIVNGVEYRTNTGYFKIPIQKNSQNPFTFNVRDSNGKIKTFIFATNTLNQFLF